MLLLPTGQVLRGLHIVHGTPPGRVDVWLRSLVFNTSNEACIFRAYDFRKFLWRDVLVDVEEAKAVGAVQDRTTDVRDGP